MPTTSPTRDRWPLVVAAGVTIFIAQLDSSIVGVALPAIEESLGTRTALAQWAVLGYLVPLIGLSLSAGRWLDDADPRRALVLACGGFAATSVACGLAPDIGWLIAARAAQGVCGAVLLALTSVLTARAVRPAVRGRAFGVVMLFGTLGGMSGPAIGGWLLQRHDWPWIFYLTIPAAALAAVLGSRELPPGGRLHWPGRERLTEALTCGGGAAALLAGVTLATDLAAPWALIALAAVPLLLVWNRSADAAPVRRLLGSRGVCGAHLSLSAAYTGMFTLMLLLPFVTQRGLGLTPGSTGLVLLAMAGATAVGSLAGGRIADRLGARPVAVAGLILAATGALALARSDGDWGAAELVWRLGCTGLGFGLFNGQNQVLAMNATPPGQLGMVAGTTGLTRQMSIAMGSAIGASCWTLSPSPDSALRTGGLTAAALLLAAAVALARTHAVAPPAAPDPAEPASARV